MPNHNHKKTGAAAKAGVGLAALAAAAAAGAYYFYGSKDSAKHRKTFKGWTVKAKGEVMEKMEKLQKLDRESYNKIVDQVISHYRGAKNISVAELVALGTELKGHWDNITKSANKNHTKTVAKPKRTRAKTGTTKK